MVYFRLLVTVFCMAFGANQATAHGEYDEKPPFIVSYMKHPAMLVFSKTESYRHNEGIAGADHFFATLARERGLGFFSTANGAVFNDEQLSRFDVIIFNNVTGDALSPDQEAAFKRALKNGMGWIGLHGSGDASKDDWPWYRDSLIGPVFIGHPARDQQFQEARVVNLRPAHPVMTGIPAEWLQVEEWYSFDNAEKVGDATVLAGLDEDSYVAHNASSGQDLRMGGGPSGHPVIWVRCIGKGRTFYSAMGHWPETYDVPIYRQLLTNAYDWVSAQKAETGC